MMKFTLGLALICFTLIIGGYQYFSNQDLISVRERGVRDLSLRLDQNQRLIQRLQTVRQNTMVRGEDQKFTIERALNIGEPGLSFNFTGQPQRAGGGNSFYRHNYRITGPARFDEAYRVLKDVAQAPGFTVSEFCYGCTRRPRDVADDVHMVQIEGYLYVYDPATL